MCLAACSRLLPGCNAAVGLLIPAVLLLPVPPSPFSSYYLLCQFLIPTTYTGLTKFYAGGFPTATSGGHSVTVDLILY